MTKAYGLKRLKSFENKYLALGLVAVALLFGQFASAQGFPTRDSLHRYNNRWIRNSAVEAFSQLRLNTLLHGIISHIDSVEGGGGSSAVDTIYAVNDSTIRYRKNGVNTSISVKGTASRKVDTLYKLNDSTLRFTIAGNPTDVLVGGYSSGAATQAYVDSVFSTIPQGVISVGYGFTGIGTFDDPYQIDTLPESNGLVTHSKLYLTIDSLGALIGGGGADVAAGFGLIESPANTLSLDSNLIATRSAMYVAIDSLAAAVITPDGSETIIVNSSTTSVGGDGTSDDPYIINVTGIPGSNPMNALDIRSFGGVADAVVSGTNVTGTNNSIALQAAINAAASGQLIIVPDGRWLFSTPLDTIDGRNSLGNNADKRINILILGTTYHVSGGTGVDFMIFGNKSGPLEQHTVEHWGFCIGRVGMPTHSRTTYLNNTKPNWATFTGTPFKIYNTYQIHIRFNKIEGFKNGVEIIGNDYDGAGRGSQENTISGRWLFKNANGITYTSLNGESYVDKNIVQGWDGGLMRISGGLALKVDGYSGTASNGEVYNGAFRSNQYHVLVELVDSIAEFHGDITEPLLDVTVEGGTATGVMGAVGFRMRSVSPNYVRDPKYNGRGVYSINWIQNGLGINARGDVPIWNSANGRRYANKWETDGSGNMVMIGSTLTKFQRDDSPSTFSYAPGLAAEKYSTVTGATYTAVAGEVIAFNNASGTLTLPSASANMGRRITVLNTHATNALTISNAATYTSIPAGDNMTWLSNGTDWRGVVNAEGTGGGGGSSIFTADAAGYFTASKLALGGGSSSSSTWLRMGASTNSVSSFRVPNGLHPTVPVDGDEWRVGKERFTSYNAIVYQYLTVPDNGAAGQVIKRNSANDDYEHSYGHTALGNYRAISNANATVLDSDYAVFIHSQTATRTLTLPSAASYPNRVLIIGHSTGNGSQVNLSTSILDPTGTATGVILNNNNFMIMSDGTNWRIIMQRL